VKAYYSQLQLQYHQQTLGVMSKTNPSWEKSRLEHKGEEQHCILIPYCSCPIFDSLEGCLVRSQYRGPRVATVNRKFPTVNRKLPVVNRKFPTGNIKFSTADLGNKGKAVKASACWIWKPTHNLSNEGNISYLSDYEPFDRGYVSFGQGRCKIAGKGTIKTSKLEFENVYFVKDFEYNLFTCHKSVITRTMCFSLIQSVLC
nr:hypothetical protein [Tanacetum cinerariifolium]